MEIWLISLGDEPITTGISARNEADPLSFYSDVEFYENQPKNKNE